MCLHVKNFCVNFDGTFMAGGFGLRDRADHVLELKYMRHRKQDLEYAIIIIIVVITLVEHHTKSYSCSLSPSNYVILKYAMLTYIFLVIDFDIHSVTLLLCYHHIFFGYCQSYIAVMDIDIC